MDVLTSLALGICLSAACGFRVFVPLFLMSAAGLAGYFSPAEEFGWISTWPAFAVLGTATVVEIVAYYVPWADNVLDTIASPAALLAGIVASASVLGDLPPYLQWTLAAVAGGGAAGVVQTGTVLLRGTSTVTTGGLGNFAVATLENGLALVTTVLAFIVPILVAICAVATAVFVWRRVVRRTPPADQPAGGARARASGR